MLLHCQNTEHDFIRVLAGEFHANPVGRCRRRPWARSSPRARRKNFGYPISMKLDPDSQRGYFSTSPVAGPLAVVRLSRNNSPTIRSRCRIAQK
jgi:hypothetical protein